MIESFFTLLGALLLVVFILFLSYYVTKYLAKGATKLNGASYMKIIDRIALGQDQSILIIQIGDAYHLIGSSDQSISLLKELNPEDLHFLEESAKQKAPDLKQSFRTILKERIKKS